MSLQHIRIVSLSIAVTLSLLMTALWRVPNASAENAGTVIVDQRDTEFLGEWGLATPVGVITGTTRLFTSKEKPAGNYSLTVTPPAGALVHIDVLNEDTLTKSFDSRTAGGILGSGGTLKFVISYDFVLTGMVSVISDPPGLKAILKGPRGSQNVVTPFSADNMPEGTYSVTYLLPTGCRPVAPIARSLERGERVTFSHESLCPLLVGEPPEEPVPPPPPSPTPPPPPPSPPPTRPENPLRVSLSSATAEITAGATARLTASVFNRGTRILRNLTVDYRFDGTRLSVQGTQNGTIGTNQVTWTIPSLSPNEKWEESFAVRAGADLENGAILGSTITVLGEDLEDVALSQRSASRQLSVIKILPKTGVPLDLLFLGVSAVSGLTVSAAGGVRRMRRR